jgi:hypothetical protein
MQEFSGVQGSWVHSENESTGRCHRQMCRQIFPGKEISWPIITFWDFLQSILQFPPSSVIALTAVRDKDKEVYSVTASC